MQTEQHAIINAPGQYKGFSSHSSGEGFSWMRFAFLGASDAEFDDWVAKARAEGRTLSRETYRALAQPSTRHPVERFASVEDGLYHRIMNLCVENGQLCMDEMMMRDALRNRAYYGRLTWEEQLALSRCTPENTPAMAATAFPASLVLE